jgi:Trk K+ transport system NAD-binding subunit
MDDIFFLIMRRMRTPLLLLIVAFAAAIVGLVLIPGEDGAGNPTRLGFFHAFYVVAYTATTIGFGELPHAFTDAQRLWVSLCIFATVAVWLYAAGALIALLQDATLKRAVAQRRFRRRVRRLYEPFYLVCGYGQTGAALVRALTDRHQDAVAIDIDPERIGLLALEDLREYVPALCGDARRPANLEAAGLGHRLCRGVVALTDHNEANLQIAIAAKLLRPKLPVICRADSHEVEANLASFGTDHIYDPFDTFALYMATAIEAPCLTLLVDWLSGMGEERLREPIYPPAKGRWIVCGFGRLGKAMYRHLKEQGLELSVVESDPQLTGTPREGVVQGRGTDAPTLEQAGVRQAAGLVAATDNDADNLSIVMTARDLNRELFVVARQNHLDNRVLFERVGAQVVMHPSTIVAHRIRVRLALPLLSEFANMARFQDEAWACELVSRVAALVEDRPPLVWQIEVGEDECGALWEADVRGLRPTLETMLQDPRDRGHRLPAIPLLIEQQDRRLILPNPDTRVRRGDRLLLCGRESARRLMVWTQRDMHTLHYLLTGEHRPEAWVWRRLARWQRSRPRSGRRAG